MALLLLLSAPAVARAGLLEVWPKGAEFLSEALVEQVKAIPGVAKVERYLYVKARPHPVIGVEAGSPLRIITGEGKLITPKLEAGRPFEAGDERVAIVGKVYREDYGLGDGMMAMMKHPFEVGSSFTFPGTRERIRVVGKFAEAAAVFLPLTTAQRLFDMKGKTSYLFVHADDAEGVAREIRRGLGDSVEVVSR